MEETKVIKVLLLSSQEIVVSEIEEVAAEFGDPNCKLTKNPDTNAMHTRRQHSGCGRKLCYSLL